MRYIKHRKYPRVLLTFIIIFTIFIGIFIFLRQNGYLRKWLRPYIEKQKINLQVLQSDSIDKDDAAQKPLIVKDLSNRFTFTFPAGAFGDYRGQIETLAMGRHGHDFDDKYRLIQDTLIIGGEMRKPIEIELKKPFKVSSVYNPKYTDHINTNLLKLLYTHDVIGSTKYPWEELATSIDASKNMVSATATKLGNFVLVGPLKCPHDIAEPDDNYDSSTLIPSSEFDKPYKMFFDIPLDQNWVRLLTKKGLTYRFEVKKTIQGINPIIEVYDSGGVEKVAEGTEFIEWTPPQNLYLLSPEVNYFVAIKADENSFIGCNAEFDLVVTGFVK